MDKRTRPKKQQVPGTQLYSYPAYMLQTPANTRAKLLPVLVLMVPLKSFHNTEGFSFTFQ